MPRPRKGGLNHNNDSMTSFTERIPTKVSKEFMPVIGEAEVLTLGMLKDALIKEISNVKRELKDLKLDFKKFDSRLIQMEEKLNIYEKTTLQLQKEVKNVQEEVLLVKKS